ncbi:MAG: septum formation initiator family protein [Gemmatimonadetes bacterium]|nr:septum formation initiator family protein [Gemmatimonadota bacterium]
MKRTPLRLRYLRFDLRSHLARRQLAQFTLLGAGLWVLHTFLLGDHSIIALQKLRSERQELTTSLLATQTTIDSLQTIAGRLENDPVFIERLAREEYLMLRPGERQYLFVPVPESERDAILSGAEPGAATPE